MLGVLISIKYAISADTDHLKIKFVISSNYWLTGWLIVYLADTNNYWSGKIQKNDKLANDMKEKVVASWFFPKETL